MNIATRLMGLGAAGSVLLALGSRAAEIPKAPVPKSPYMPIVYRYADTMLQHGRDTVGPQSTGLFLSALDRTTLKPLMNTPPAPSGIRPGDRVGKDHLIGANPQHDQNLLRLLYTLHGLSGSVVYKEAADAALRWFMENGRSVATDLLPWGEHMSWDALTDAPYPPDDTAVHEFFRPWLLWDRCFLVAPEASRKFALGLWHHQVADQNTGAFDRHAGYWKHATYSENDFPRHGGFLIRAWAAAYAHTRDAVFTNAIAVLLTRFESQRHTATGLIPSRRGHPIAWPGSNLSLAIDCDGAAHSVPEPLASRLRSLAGREDDLFARIAHPVKEAGGFITTVQAATGVASDPPTPLWKARYGGYTTAQVGMMLVSRYDNSAKPASRDLMLAAADAYSNALPKEDADVWPGTLGQAISLQLAAWRHTANPAYLEGARRMADWSLIHLWDTHPLPRASAKTDHYETITGADTLALSFTELHLQILAITAVRCPPNTADR